MTNPQFQPPKTNEINTIYPRNSSRTHKKNQRKNISKNIKMETFYGEKGLPLVLIRACTA
jgi:hypothetical protein